MKLHASIMWLLCGLLSGGTVNLFGQDDPPDFRSSKPDFPPSYQLHVSPTQVKYGTSDSSGPDYWSARGYDLRAIIAKLYEFEPNRIDLPASLEDDARYDFAMVLPRVANKKEIIALVKQGINEQFGLIIRFETRPTDVYVLTAPNGQTPAMKASHDDPASGGGFTASNSSLSVAVNSPHGRTPTSQEQRSTAENILQSARKGSSRGISSIRRVSLSHSTMAQFCQTLELGLDRLVVDETNLKGTYGFETHGEAANTEEFFAMLRNQLGLTLSAAQRDIAFLVVRHK